jgi:hypothetical protein
MTLTLSNLPPEIRNKIYKLCLIARRPLLISPQQIWHEFEMAHISSSLRRVNKIIAPEASSIFYGSNMFDLRVLDITELACFFEMIGARNASLIQRIKIPFPQWYCTSPPVMWESYKHALSIVEQACTSLKTIWMTQESTHIMAMEIIIFQGKDKVPDPVFEPVIMVGRRLDSIPTLKRIIASIQLDESDEGMRIVMRDLGWHVRTARDSTLDSDDFCA